MLILFYLLKISVFICECLLWHLLKNVRTFYCQCVFVVSCLFHLENSFPNVLETRTSFDKSNFHLPVFTFIFKQMFNESSCWTQWALLSNLPFFFKSSFWHNGSTSKSATSKSWHPSWQQFTFLLLCIPPSSMFVA